MPTSEVLRIALLVWLAAMVLVAAQDDVFDDNEASNESGENLSSAPEDGADSTHQKQRLRTDLKRLLSGNSNIFTPPDPPASRRRTNYDSDSTEDVREYDPYRDNFYDQFADGTYVYGYALPNGVTRFERSLYSEEYKGLVVEGFYTQPRFYGHKTVFELRCYRADYLGYRALRVQYLNRPPLVQRDTEPDVDCFD